MVRPFSTLALLAALASAAMVQHARAGDPNLLKLQATARMGVDLAAGNHCAAMELRPVIEATARYLGGAANVSPADDVLIDETRALLAGATYDPEPCDRPCAARPATTTGTGDEAFAPEATLRYLHALDAVTSHWLAAAEGDPPTLTLTENRRSYDPLPRFAPGEPVAYAVHVGPACHGAVLWLDRPYTLPSHFEGQGSFVPPLDGLWTIDVSRFDGLTTSPLTYLDTAGLPAYAKDFWVATQPTGRLGPGRVGPWHKRPSW